MAFEASSSSSYASTSEESVVVAAQELLFVLNTLNEKRKAKTRNKQHFQQHPDPRLKPEMPEVIESQAQSQSRSHKLMELSQIELIYRAEGNANLVLALPQFKKVLRLPKVQQQQQQKQYQAIQYNQKHSQQQQQQGEQQMQRENQQDVEKQQEPNQILTTGQQQRKNSKNGKKGYIFVLK